jgi:PKD repeat protein
MQGLQPSVILASALLWVSASVHAQEVLPPQDPLLNPDLPVAEHSFARLNLVGPAGATRETYRINEPGAKYVKVHFSEFNPPAGMFVEVSNPERTEVYRYSKRHRDNLTLDAARGDDGINRFSAMSVSGDTAIVRMIGMARDFNPHVHRVILDSWMHRNPAPPASPPRSKIQKETGDGKDKPEFSCGAEERYDAVCWSDTNPEEYDRSRAVAMLVTADGFECTAWRVGSDNRMFTAEHCLRDQEELDGAEIWFNYEASRCGGSSTGNTVKVTGKDLLATDKTLDYALFSVNDFASISKFGTLGLDVRQGNVGENIFIPQHGLGNPRQISLESDMNTSGLCEIDDNDMNAYGVGTDIGYFCDTTNSSSGSPVISTATGRAIALHHLGGCLNMGSKVSLIWPQVKQHFNNQVPKGDGDINSAPPNEVPEAAWAVDCDGLACSFDGSESRDGDGDISSYEWQFSDGAVASGMKIEHEFSAAGEFEVSLTVTDDEGASDTYADAVTVSAPNQDPDARFSVACVNNRCNFNGSASRDPDGDITSWRWSFGDGADATGAEVTHEYAKDGNHYVRLTVKDEHGAEDSRGQTIRITLPNSTPEARFSFSCNERDCAFNGEASSDSDGEISSWQWDFGDGSQAESALARHSFEKGGTYTVKLTVTDNDGESATVHESVSIDLPNQPPVAVMTASCKELECTFNAWPSYDRDGRIVEYRWSLGDGTEGSGRRLTHRYGEKGAFEVTLTVTDNEDASTKRSYKVTVDADRKIELNATSTVMNTKALTYLNWKGAKSKSIRILRDGKQIADTTNSGKYYDISIKNQRKLARYQVCETSSNVCSNEIKVQINL